MNNGFVILAQNTEEINYVRCAEILAKNIASVMPNANISLITDDVDDSKYLYSSLSVLYICSPSGVVIIISFSTTKPFQLM